MVIASVLNVARQRHATSQIEKTKRGEKAKKRKAAQKDNDQKPEEAKDFRVGEG